MATSVAETLNNFDPTKGEKYDPGQIIIFFDNRIAKHNEDQFSYFQTYWTEAKYRLGWPSWQTPDLEPGKLRIIWYTQTGTEGSRDYPLWMAHTVKEMFDSLSDEGFRPMVIGWSGENPFPMIGGSEPPPEPIKVEPKRATTWSSSASGHGKGATTPHDRVMNIINEEERREAEQRKQEVESGKLGDDIEGAA